MGQYYRTILTNKNGYERVYNRYVDGEYTMAKLMEHSWWRNGFVGTMCSKIFKNPMNVVWVGDYADDSDYVNGMTKEELVRLCKKAWNGKGHNVKKNICYLDDYYLVNHTKKIYIDCDEYKKLNVDNDGWVIHPLPLLTAIGNGLGGGDYRGNSTSDVGSWANDIISIEENIPDGYEKERYFFIEN